MSSQRRVAVVTGSNRGIGFAIVRGLCKQFEGDVILTARVESSGLEAVQKLQAEGLQPKFHQLDVTDSASIDRLKVFLQATYGGLDILVNNAGLSYQSADTTPLPVKAEVTMKTNFWGTLNVCKALFPLLRPHARVVNVSSLAGKNSAKICSEQLQARIFAPDVSVQQAEQLMIEFVTSTKEGTLEKDGWQEKAYGCSKTGVTLISFAYQKEFDNDPRPDIIVNAEQTLHCTWHCCLQIVPVQRETLFLKERFKLGHEIIVQIQTGSMHSDAKAYNQTMYMCESTIQQISVISFIYEILHHRHWYCG